MNSKAILLLLLAGTLVFAGCVNNGYTTPTDDGAMVDDSTALVDEWSMGTGTTEGDITTEELDDLQTDLDQLDIAVEEGLESDV